MSEEKKEILNELLFRIEAVKAAEDKKYIDECSDRAFERNYRSAAGYEESHCDAIGTRRMEFGTYSA